MAVVHEGLQQWVAEMARLCQPEKVVWLKGSDTEQRQLEKEAVISGELIRLDPERNPNSFYHRSAANDVARTEHLTYICTRLKDDAGPTNNWMCPEEGYRRAGKLFEGSMRGRIMYVVPFSMGLPDSPHAKIGVQLTDSIYVALSMKIMTHMGEAALKRLGSDGSFTKCLHSKGALAVDQRLILHFPEDNTIWSVGSDYGGNALLGKKCLALRIGSYLGFQEGWLAEHMLIMGIENPFGQITYVAAAFPSACGKTNLAMMVPPEKFRKKGYRIWTIGDDIAWLRVDKQGRLRAFNPEAGMFGVAPGTNSKTNPNAVRACERNAIFTNVLLKKDRTVWWEGADGPVPQEGVNWQGRAWSPGMTDSEGKPVLGAHPNSRFTVPLNQCPTFSRHYFDTEGVPISAIIFGGRRARLAPLVCESRNWQHGVFMGATMASERTAAQAGAVGEIRRDPMAMLPFCGYNMARYFRHWLDIGKKLSEPPKIFHVNWFRRGADGNFLWPGFGENFRILLWMVDRCREEAEPIHTSIGRLPAKNDIDLTGLRINNDQWNSLFSVDPSEWRKEIASQKAFFDIFGHELPSEFRDEQEILARNLRDLESKIVVNL